MAFGRNGEATTNVPSPAEEAQRRGRGRARDHSSAEETAMAPQRKRSSVGRASAQWMAYSRIGQSGLNVVKNAVVEIKRELANVKVHFSVEGTAPVDYRKPEPAIPSIVPWMESGMTGDNGATAPKLARVVSPSDSVLATVLFTAVATAMEITKK